MPEALSPSGGSGSSIAAQALDALPSHIAVVNSRGVIVAVNRAWRAFAHAHGASDAGACEGRSLFDVCCLKTDEPGRPEADQVTEGLRRVLNGSLAVFEAEQAFGSGADQRWSALRITPIATGSDALAVLAYDDITARKQVELTLVETEQALERAQAIAAVGNWSVDLVAGTFTTSPEAGRMGGWLQGPRPLAELVDRIHPDDRERQREAWVAALKGAPYDVQHRMVTIAGVRWVRVKAEFAFGADGRAVRAFGVLQDITEAKLAVDELAENRARLGTLFNTIPDMVFVKDVSGRYVGCNRAAERALGISESDLAGQTDFDVFPPELAERSRAHDASAVRSGGPVRREVRTISAVTGRRQIIETIKTPMFFEGRLVGVLDISRDVTEQRRVDEALARSEQQKQFALDAAQLGVWSHVPGTGRIALDARAQRIWDVDDYEMDAVELVMSRVHPDDQAALIGSPTTRSSAQGGVEFRIRDREGIERWLQSQSREVLGAASDGAPPVSTTHGTVQDITERKRAVETVARFVAASPVVIYALGIVNERFAVRWVSGNLAALTGWTFEQARADTWLLDNIHPDDRSRVIEANALPIPGDRVIQEFRFRRADGRFIWLRDEKRVLRDAGHAPAELVGSWSDITQRVALEEQLRQAHKLEAIGLLAGGIAHDFNNLLTVIGGNTDLLMRLIGDTTEAHELLSEIRDAGDRASSLTRQLLAFSRSQVLAPSVEPLNRLVTRVTSILTRLIGEDILCESELSDEAGYVKVDAGQFEQVMLNLAVNARDAMPRGGRLLIQTSRAMLDDTYARVHPDVAPGSYAVLTMTDTGTGMAPELIERIFEPFFTTKEASRGTGLGLSMAFGIVKQSGGHIDVTSRPGGGSTFQIYLPQVAPVPVASPLTRTEPQVPRHGHETVLLVEDEEIVGKLARVALEHSGYQVLYASNGREALELAEQHGDSIDILVSDVVMPEMHGPDLAQVLCGRRPGLRVLFISGYVQDGDERLGVSESNFLAKPFSLKELSDKVRAVLDSEP